MRTFPWFWAILEVFSRVPAAANMDVSRPEERVSLETYTGDEWQRTEWYQCFPWHRHVGLAVASSSLVEMECKFVAVPRSGCSGSSMSRAMGWQCRLSY